MNCEACGQGEHQRRYVVRVLSEETAKARRDGLVVGIAIGIGITALVATVIFAGLR